MTRAAFATLLGVGALLLACGRPSVCRAQADDPLADTDEAADAAPETNAPPPEPKPADEPAADERAHAAPEKAPKEAAAAQASAGAAEESAEPVPEQASEHVVLRVAAGAGVGTLALDRPTMLGRQHLPRTPFAACAADVRLLVGEQRPLAFEFRFGYLTSVGLALDVAPEFALDQTVSARAQHAELSAAPIVRLGNSPSALALAVPVGVALDSLVPELHQFGLPNYVLAGPALGAELLVPLGELARLRIGPEAQWLVFVDRSLRVEGACCQGAAVGGRGSLEASVGSSLRVALDYRESHVFVPGGARKLTDVRRFLTAMLAGRF